MRAKNNKKKGPLLAIDLGSHSIKVVQGQELGNRLKVTQWAVEKLGPGVYENGLILDAPALKSILTEMIKANHFKVKNVALSIECTEIIKREMIIPKVDEEDQMDLIQYEVSQYLPIDINSYVLEYKVLENFIEDGNSKLRILLGAMPKDIVSSHHEWLESCGLNPVYMDMHSNALEKLVSSAANENLYAASKTTAYVDFGHGIIDISLFEKEHYKFNRLLKMGGSGFDDVLVHHLEIPLGEAENRKKKTSILAIQKAYMNLENNPEAAGDIKNSVVRETMHYMNECMDEMDKVFKYYTSRSAENKIDQIYVYGGGSQFKELPELFRERFGIPTDVMKNLPNIDFVKNNAEALPLFINAMGTLIRN